MMRLKRAMLFGVSMSAHRRPPAAHLCHPRNRSGSLAMLAAIRRPSSWLISVQHRKQVGPSSTARAGGSGEAALPRSEVVGLGRRVAHDFPSSKMTYLPQLLGFAVPHCDDVLRLKRYDKIFAIAADRYLSPIRNRVPSKGLNDIKCRHLPPHATNTGRAGERSGNGRNVDLPVTLSTGPCHGE